MKVCAYTGFIWALHEQAKLNKWAAPVSQVVFYLWVLHTRSGTSASPYWSGCLMIQVGYQLCRYKQTKLPCQPLPSASSIARNYGPPQTTQLVQPNSNPPHPPSGYTPTPQLQCATDSNHAPNISSSSPQYSPHAPYWTIRLVWFHAVLQLLSSLVESYDSLLEGNHLSFFSL